MKRLIAIIFVLIFSTAAFASPSKITKSGKCKLYEAELSEKEKIFTLELQNDDIKAICDFRGKISRSESFRLIGNPKIKNLTSKELYISYNAAFFDDANNLIASICQCSKLEPDNKDHQFGSALTNLPKSEFDKISSYQLIIYIEENFKD